MYNQQFSVKILHVEGKYQPRLISDLVIVYKVLDDS